MVIINDIVVKNPKKTVLRQTGEAFVLLFCHDLWLNSNSNKKNYQF